MSDMIKLKPSKTKQVDAGYGHLADEFPEAELDSKLLGVAGLQRAGYRTVFIGNGAPDFPAALRSDIVFARDNLLNCCVDAKLPHYPFEDFTDVLRRLQHLRE